MPYHHISVLPDETMHYLQPNNGFYIDCTFGGGGHTKQILENHPKNEVLALDCDNIAIENGKKKLSSYKSRLSFYQTNFRDIAKIPAEIIANRPIKGILMDIGVSSHHFDCPKRGFSFRSEAPLDMRMNPKQELTAMIIVNEWDAVKLNDIIRDYGEEKHHKIIVDAIIRHRQIQPLRTTLELATMIDKVLRRWHKQTLPAPTKTFQALRIAVNDEIHALKEGLHSCFDLLAEDGHLVVISFHSLEDRIVKKFFKEKNREIETTTDPFTPNRHNKSLAKALTSKPIIATKEEINRNPRSSCAKLRAIKKVGL